MLDHEPLPAQSHACVCTSGVADEKGGEVLCARMLEGAMLQMTRNWPWSTGTQSDSCRQAKAQAHNECSHPEHLTLQVID